MQTPEQQTSPSRARIVSSRRRFAASTGLAAATLALLPAASRAASNLALGVYEPKGSGTTTTPTSYEGPLFGHEVTWDDAIWLYSLSADEMSGYDYDYVSLSGIQMDALSNVTHQEVPFEDVETAIDEALPHYLSQYGSGLDDVEVLDSWDSDEAVGIMWYWLDYEDKPYTYVEYSLTDEPGIWCVTYIQFRASAWDENAVADLLGGIEVDGDPLVRAGDIDNIVAAVASDVE